MDSPKELTTTHELGAKCRSVKAHACTCTAEETAGASLTVSLCGELLRAVGRRALGLAATHALQAVTSYGKQTSVLALLVALHLSAADRTLSGTSHLQRKTA